MADQWKNSRISQHLHRSNVRHCLTKFLRNTEINIEFQQAWSYKALRYPVNNITFQGDLDLQSLLLKVLTRHWQTESETSSHYGNDSFQLDIELQSMWNIQSLTWSFSETWAYRVTGILAYSICKTWTCKSLWKLTEPFYIKF